MFYWEAAASIININLTVGTNPVIFLSKILPKGMFGKKIEAEHLLHTGSAIKYTTELLFLSPKDDSTGL